MLIFYIHSFVALGLLHGYLPISTSLSGSEAGTQVELIIFTSLMKWELITIITFDNGTEWNLLPAPEVTINDDEADCEVV